MAPQELLRPQLDWEGAQLKVESSLRGELGLRTSCATLMYLTMVMHSTCCIPELLNRLSAWQGCYPLDNVTGRQKKARV